MDIHQQKANKIVQDLINKGKPQVEKEVKKEEEVLPNTIKLKGKLYKIEPMNGTDGLNLWEYILQRILPSVGTGLDTMQNKEDFVESTTFTEAMMHLSNKLDGDSFKLISLAVFDNATVDGQPLDVDEEFKANYGTWRTLLVFALKVNFSSFFELGWAQGIKDLMALVSPQFQE